MPRKGQTGDVTLIPQGEEWDVEWKMNFTSLSKEDDAWYWSPQFSFEGERWFFQILPNGSKSMNSSGYIHLRLEKYLSYGPPINVEFWFSLKSVNGEKYFRKQTTGTFDNNVDCHEIARFLPRDFLEKRQSEFLSSSFLTVVCTMKRIKATGSANEIAKAACSHCERTFEADEISPHEKKCRIKCPDCSSIVLYERWQDHECQISRDEGGTHASASSEVCHHDRILQDLKQLFLNQENCDVILKVKGREFHAHSAILTARSSVFASTFRNDMKEKQTGIVDIEDCDPSSFPDFLCFLYSDDVESLSEENVFSLFTAADKYDVTDLRTKCLGYMKENVTVDTFCETLTMALRHSETELLHLCTNFFIKNAEETLETVKWQSFVAENPTQGNELFIKYVKSKKYSNK